VLAETKREGRQIRHLRIRRWVRGASSRPRLSVFRSLKHIYAQLVDDEAGSTLASVSSASAEFKERLRSGGNVAAAKLLGEMVAQKAKAKGIERVVFDRGGYRYHGRIKAFAEAARAGGLIF
jgi:large subunit ribosomal protein L18